MKKLLLILAALAMIFSCKPEEVVPVEEPETPEEIARREREEFFANLRVDLFTLDDVAEITDTSAIVSGRADIFNAGAATVIRSGFRYGRGNFRYVEVMMKHSQLVYADTLRSYGGVFKCRLDSLRAESPYTFMAFVEVADSILYGPMKYFSTQPAPKPVSVTGEASDITVWSATLTGYANPNKDTGKLRPGIVYSATDPEPTRESGMFLGVTNVDDNNMYSVSVEGLASNTTYYYRSYATYGGGTTDYGTVKSFTTSAIDASVQALEPSGVTQYEAGLRGLLTLVSDLELPVTIWFRYGLAGESMQVLGADASFCARATRLNCGSEYVYEAVAKVYDTEFSSEPFTFSTLDFAYDAHAVDLGLGVMWADVNLGAAAPEEPGVYFAWGMTEPKAYFSWSNYDLCLGTDNTLTAYCPFNKPLFWGGEGDPDNLYVLLPQDDAASVKLPAGWRMPTREEFDNLRLNCTWTWMVSNDVPGYLVTGRNGNSIFMPAAGFIREYGVVGYDGTDGYYWSSSLSDMEPALAHCLHFAPGSQDNYKRSRCFGMPIRAVFSAE